MATRILWPVLFVALAAGRAGLAATVSGSVVDAVTKQPVPVAAVKLDSLPIDGQAEAAGTTGGAGEFAVDGVPAGTFKLTVVHPMYAPYSEKLVLADADAVTRAIELAPYCAGIGCPPSNPQEIDVFVQVACIATQVALEGATVDVVRFKDPAGAVPDRRVTVVTDANGLAGASRLPPGFYRFAVTLPGWETYAFPANGTAMLNQDHSASVWLKPVKGKLEVEVVGYTFNWDRFNMKDTLVEVDGIDPASLGKGIPLEDLPSAVPARTVLADFTKAGSTVVFEDLPRIPWRLRAYRPGYEPAVVLVTPDAIDAPKPLKVHLAYMPTTLFVELDNEYKDKELFLDGVGVNIRVDGVAGSATDGYSCWTRFGWWDPADPDCPFFHSGYYDPATGKRSYEFTVPPGKLVVTYEGEEYQVDADQPYLPYGSLPLRFQPKVVFAEAEAGQDTTVSLDLETVPARVSGRLVEVVPHPSQASECLKRPLAAQGIEFVEVEGYDFLPDGRKKVVVDTDEDGNFHAVLPPSVWSVRIPTLPGYMGLRLEATNRMNDRWPYASDENTLYERVWPIGSVGVDAILEVRKEAYNVFGQVGKADLYSELTIHGIEQPYNDLAAAGKVTVDEPLPIQRRANKGDLWFESFGVVPGSYTVTGDHPRYDFTSAALAIKSWGYPGAWVPDALSGWEPEKNGYYTACGIQAGITVTMKSKAYNPKIRWYQWNDQDQIYGLKSENSTYGLFRPDWSEHVFKTAIGGIPADAYRLWINSPCQTGFVFVQGTKDDLIELYCGGPGATPTSPLSDWPKGEPYNVVVRAYNRDDRATLMPVKVVAGSLTFDSCMSESSCAPVSVSSTDLVLPDMTTARKWSVAGEARRFVSVGTPPEVRIDFYLQRTLNVSGQVTSGGAPVKDARVTLYDRFGRVLRAEEPVDEEGRFDSLTAGNFKFQPIYVGVVARGFLPQRKKFATDPFVQDAADKADITADVSLVPAPPPTVDGFTLDREGLFLPGVLKTGDQSGFDPKNAMATLTATWKVSYTPATLDYTLEGFDNPDGTPGDTHVTTLDEVVRVVVFDPRRFSKPPLLEYTTPEPVVLSEAAKFAEASEVVGGLNACNPADIYGDPPPCSFVHQAAVEPSATATSASGAFRLWELPPGTFRPVAVLFSRNGGVAVKELPSGGKPLHGVRLPKWFSYVTDLLGIISTYNVVKKLDSEQLSKTAKLLGPASRFVMSGEFESRVDLTGHCLEYLFFFGVKWTEGMKGPPSGFLSWGNKMLGLFQNARIEFKVIGEAGKVQVSGSGSLKDGEILHEGLHKPAAVPEGTEPKVQSLVLAKSTVKNSAKLTAELAYEPADPNVLSDLSLVFDVRSFLDTRVKADLTPILSKIPYAGPVLAGLKKTKVLETFGVFDHGFGGHATGRLDTGLPKAYVKNPYQCSGNCPQPQRFDLFAIAPKVSGGITKVLWKAGLGLQATAFGARVGATGTIQIGAPKDKPSQMGILFEVNQTGFWPPIKRVQGAVSAVLDVYVKLWIAELGKKFQWDLGRFDWKLGSEPFHDLVPIRVTTRVVTPQDASPAEWLGGPRDLLGDLYPAGTWAVAGSAGAGMDAGETAVVYADAGGGGMELKLSVGRAGAWSAPVVLASAAGVLDVDVARTGPDRWLVAWSEVSSPDWEDPNPGTTLRSVEVEADGARTGPAEVVATTPDTTHALYLDAAGGQGVLTFVSTDGGPLADAHDLWIAVRRDGRWQAPAMLDAAVEVGGIATASAVHDGAIETAVLVTRAGGDVTRYAAVDGEPDGSLTLATDGGNDAAVELLPDGTQLVVSDHKDGTVSVWTGDREGLRRTATLLSDVSPTAIDTAVAGGRLVVAWADASDGASLLHASFDLAGGSAEGPVLLAREDGGEFHEVRLVAGPEGGGAEVFARHRDLARGTNRVQEFAIPPAAAGGWPVAGPPAGPDPAGDGLAGAEGGAGDAGAGGCGGNRSPAGSAGWATVLVLALACSRRSGRSQCPPGPGG